MNAFDPDKMSTTERLDEVAEILVAGLQRLRTRQSSDQSAHCGESSLHSSGHQSGHANSLPEDLDA